jgi:hypothetical protein
VEYDFNFNRLEFGTDVPCLVLSEGRSMLTCDSQVMIRPTEVVGPTLVKAKFSSIGSILTVALLERLRKYLTYVRHLPFEVTDEVQVRYVRQNNNDSDFVTLFCILQKAVQDDFVNERQNNGHASMTAEDLHSMLVLGRLLSMSYGLKTLTPEIWQKVKLMEKERKERVVHLPQRPLAPR